jgi:hypothetical protein
LEEEGMYDQIPERTLGSCAEREMRKTVTKRGASGPTSGVQSGIPRVSKREYDGILEEAVDRELRRWLRRVLLVMDGNVRHFTKDEVDDFAKRAAAKHHAKDRQRKGRA